MQQYLTEKLGHMEKILEITREQHRFIGEKDLSRFNLYLDETSKIIRKIKKLDRLYGKTADSWNSGKTAIQKKTVDTLNEAIKQTIGKIAALHSEQLRHFREEKKSLEAGLLSHRRDANALASYRGSQDSPGLLDIKK